MRITGLKKNGGRNPLGYFEDLPLETRRRAQRWLWQFCQRWGRNTPRWRFAILVGQAKRLALNPPTSAWGRSMLAKRGGLATQRRYRQEGRHPTANATLCRVSQQHAVKAMRQPGFRRTWSADLTGI